MKRYVSLALVLLLGLICLMKQSEARVTGSTVPVVPDALCAGGDGLEACIDGVGNLVPTTDNKVLLGSSTLRWSQVTVVDADLSGNLTTGDAATDRITINGSSVVVRNTLLGVHFGTSTTSDVLLGIEGSGGGVLLRNQTAAQLRSLIPGTTREILINSGTNSICISTGGLVGQWGCGAFTTAP